MIIGALTGIVCSLVNFKLNLHGNIIFGTPLFDEFSMCHYIKNSSDGDQKNVKKYDKRALHSMHSIRLNHGVGVDPVTVLFYPCIKNRFIGVEFTEKQTIR